MELSKSDCADIVRMADSPGFQILKSWIENRVENLTAKILSSESDLEVQSVVKSKTANKVDIMIVNLSQDANKHEIRTWKLLMDKIQECENNSRGK